MLLFEQDIPDFFRSSAYLASLLENGPFPEAGIDIPEDCAKIDSVLENESDVRRLLSTLRYWLLTECCDAPKVFYKYAFDPAHKEIMTRICKEFCREFMFLAYVSCIIGGKEEQMLQRAIVCGCMSLVRYLCEEHRIEVTDEMLLLATAGGMKECLHYLHSFGPPLTSFMAYTAAQRGNLNILKYLHENGIVMDIDVVSFTANGGHIECLRFCLDNNPASLTSTFVSTAIAACVLADRMQCLEYLWDRFEGTRVAEDEWCVLFHAANKGHVDILQFGQARQFSAFLDPVDAAMLVAKVVRADSVNCLDYLYSVGLTAGPNDVREAVVRGHLKCVKYLITHNCPFHINICCVSAEHNHLPLLQWAHATGQPWQEDCCHTAACRGHIECLRYAHEHGCPWDAAVTVIAARAPTAACLQYVVEQGASVGVETARAAASYGCLASLQYLHSVHCPWDATVCYDAVGFGSVECLRFLHEHGCPWDQRAVDVAAANAQNGKPGCLEYIQQHQALSKVDKV